MEDLSELIEKNFALTHDLILGKPRRVHKVNISPEKLEQIDEEPPYLSEKNSELALKILTEYGLVKRYTDEKCLYKIDRLRKYILEREQKDEMEQR